MNILGFTNEQIINMFVNAKNGDKQIDIFCDLAGAYKISERRKLKKQLKEFLEISGAVERRRRHFENDSISFKESRSGNLIASD